MNESWARRVWARRGLLGWPLWCLALPLSLLYSLAVRVRNLFYSLGLLPSKNLPCAVVSIGNLTVGGTGKTPTTLWLAQELGRQGYQVAILSRGYKRTGSGAVVLEPGSGPASALGEESFGAGDEPVMMARLFHHRVGVGKDRYEAGLELLRRAPVDVFLLDDGFQHRQLRRDVDLLLLGADSSGRLLPAGPFREPRSALRRADQFLVTGARDEWEPILARNGKASTLYFGSVQARCLWGGGREYPLSILARSKILTVAGIANPQPFYRIIHEWEGEIVDAMEFPDHHLYGAKDWQQINRAAHKADLIVTTEKDLLKLARFPFSREKLLALRVEMVVENGSALVRAVAEAIQRKSG